MKRMEELDSSLDTATELEGYLKRVRELYRDLHLELAMAAEVLQQNLSTLPVADSTVNGGVLGAATSRARARKVANSLKRASESSKYCGGQAVKCWREFVKAFAPEIDAARNPRQARQPKFDVNN